MGEPSWTLVEEPSRVQEQSPQLRQQTPAVEESGLEKLHAWAMKPKNIAKCIWLPYWLAGKGVQKAHSILTGQDSNQNEPASAPRRVDPRVQEPSHVQEPSQQSHVEEPSWTLVEEPSRVQEQSPQLREQRTFIGPVQLPPQGPSQLRQQTPAVEESRLDKLHAWAMKPKNIAKCIWLPYWLAGKGVQ